MELIFVDGRPLYRYNRDVVKSYLTYDSSCSRTRRTKRQHEATKVINNSIITFDTEAYSYSSEIAITYVWTMCVNGTAFYGRTVDELKDFFEYLTTIPQQFYVWVHGLHYDFYYLDHTLGNIIVRAREKHKPIAAHWNNVTFRCTYTLTNLKLEDLAIKYNLSHKKGKMDYTLPRTPITPLTVDELSYCTNDVLVVYDYIKLIRPDYETLADIPTTATKATNTRYYKYYEQYSGYKCYDSKGRELKNMSFTRMRQAFQRYTINMQKDADIYQAVSDATHGAFAYCNPDYINDSMFSDDKIYLISADIHSDYPYQMIAHKYSMVFGRVDEIATLSQFLKRTKNDYGIATFYFPSLKVKPEGFEIITKEWIKDQPYQDLKLFNTHVVEVKNVKITCNNIEYLNIRDCYDFDESAVEISDVYIGVHTQHLFVPTIKFIADNYRDKTELKGTGNCKAYEEAKVSINSIPGLCQMDVTKDFANYKDGKWVTEDNITDVQKQTNRWRNLKGRNAQFVLYQWGTFILSHARRDLITLNLKIGKDNVLYNDTDGVKIIVRGYDEYKRIIRILKERDEEVRQNIINMCNNISKTTDVDFTLEDFSPKGELIGTMPIEAEYTGLKILHTKCYLTCLTKQINGKPYHIIEPKTASYNKAKVLEVLTKDIKPDYTTEFEGTTYNHYRAEDLEEIFDRFNPDLVVPEATMTVYYTNDMDEEIEFTDYIGNKIMLKPFKGMSLFPSPKKLSDVQNKIRSIFVTPATTKATNI